MFYCVRRELHRGLYSYTNSRADKGRSSAAGGSKWRLARDKLTMYSCDLHFHCHFSSLAFASMQPQPFGADVMEQLGLWEIRAVMEISLVDPMRRHDVSFPGEVSVHLDTQSLSVVCTNRSWPGLLAPMVPTSSTPRDLSAELVSQSCSPNGEF